MNCFQDEQIQAKNRIKVAIAIWAILFSSWGIHTATYQPKNAPSTNVAGATR